MNSLMNTYTEGELAASRVAKDLDKLREELAKLQLVVIKLHHRVAELERSKA